VGGSTGPLDGLSLHHLAADIAGVIKALAAAPAHVVGHAFGNRVARCLATDRPELVRSAVLLAAGGLVPTDAEARRAAHRLRHETLTEAERLELRKAAYLSPVSDPRLMLQVQQSPLWAAGDLTETVSQATPSPTGGRGARRLSSWSQGWMTAVGPSAMTGRSTTKWANGYASWTFPRRGTSSSWSSPMRWPRL
jgi:pimeloyl-ACP methyl ester carboxylesterase